MAKIIKIEISDDATFTVDLTGFNGQGCGDIIKAFAQLGEVTKEIHKPEWKSIQTNLQKAGR
jgi:hypothetical protein